MATPNHKLPDHLAKKYKALIVPTTLHCPVKDDKGIVTGEKIIDMRTMSEEDADWLCQNDKEGNFLKKLTKEDKAKPK